jgi:AraC-like DNA-binding protein
MNNIIKEITPLTQNDCFTISSRVKSEFNFPLHFHEEFELNLIVNAKGAKRIVGNSVEEIENMELVLIAPNLSHGWVTHHCESREITEVTIQWHKDLFDEKFLKKNQLAFIRRMLERSSRGILFPKETAELVYKRLLAINQMQGFDSVLELMSIIHQLSTAKSMRQLSDGSFNNEQVLNYHSRRIDKAYEFMNANFHKPISLKDISKLVNMTEVSFSRFIKKRTGNTFIDSLNEIRLGHATKMLIETTHSVAEISYKCGFNNISNFNRFFKKKKQCTPKEFRQNYSGTRVFI